MNVNLILTGLLGFFWGGFVTPLSIKLAHQFQIIDLPDARKLHTIQMPRGAGLTLWCGYLLWALYFVSYSSSVRYTATGATFVFLCGYMDDMKPLSPFIRLFVHLLTAALVVLPLDISLFAKAICLFWIGGTTSAYNLIDGLNGLCISLFIASAIALCFIGAPSFGVVMAAMALGVLCWNFPTAQTFLGDGGSTLLGFLISSHFVLASSQVIGQTSFNERVLLLLLFGGVPVLDTLVAFSRRIIRGKSPFYPDKGHLHHRLIDLTHSPAAAVTCLLILQAFFLMAGTAVYVRLSP